MTDKTVARTEDPDNTRVARIYPDPQSWLCELPPEWDSMAEHERQYYIYETAVDNGKCGFKYEELPK